MVCFPGFVSIFLEVYLFSLFIHLFLLFLLSSFLSSLCVVLLIPQVRSARIYSISPWEMIHLPREIEQQAYNLIRITRLCVTSHSQPLINAQHLMASNKLLVNNNKRANRAHYINYLMVNKQYNTSPILG
jgi:hypothetical protein